MKAAIYNGVKKIDFVELPMPQCDDNGIVVKNICASICGSDVTAYNYGGEAVMIYPGFEFHVIDRLITNFHLPESTLIMLISALAGKENVMNAYETAVKERYRFFSFGDSMFIQ